MSIYGWYREDSFLAGIRQETVKHKTAILTSVLVILGAGNAIALDAARGFGPSDQNDQVAPRFQSADTIDRSVMTSSVGDGARSLGFPVGAGRSIGFSAAQGFGPSDQNDQPVPRYQTAR